MWIYRYKDEFGTKIEMKKSSGGGIGLGIRGEGGEGDMGTGYRNERESVRV